jgi:hypothetical protein
MEIRRIQTGTVITEPGFYAMPIEWHHSQCCDGFSVSSSGLRAIDLYSPLHFWDQYVNPDAPEETDEDRAAEKKHFRMGRAAHTLMLEPEKFKGLYCVRPGIWKDWRTDAAKTWRLDRTKEGFTVLSGEEMLAIHGIAVALQNHRWHTEGILAGIVEVSMVVRDPKTGIWLKSRPDAIPLVNSFTDLKVLRSVKPHDVARSVKTLGYDMQLALAGVCMHLLTGETIDNFWLVTVEVNRPHAIHVATLSLESIYWARIRVRHALDRLAKCLADNYWPAYDADGQEIQSDHWQAERWKEEQSSGLLPKDDTFDG